MGYALHVKKSVVVNFPAASTSALPFVIRDLAILVH
jgi:hypothetical protein